jgi:HAD superfamily hydrolase (TIGR01490 family)
LVLAIFDLDETLISSDSDYLWGEFVVEKGLVDERTHRKKNREFYDQYKRGTLDIDAYLRFSCSVLASLETAELHRLRDEFIETRIKPLVLPGAVRRVEAHRARGDFLLVVTSTIEFLTRPIVDLFRIETLIAPIPEQRKGEYTGEIVGTPSFGPGKVERLRRWMEGRPFSLNQSYFYSDSINDLPLLELVKHPVAVDPDESLKREAESRNWKIISFRARPEDST